MTKFGLTLEQYNEMLLKQSYKCAICEINNKDTNRNLSVDHCHKTGRIRGLLCTKCNSAIAYLYENENLFLKAIEYINKYKQ